MTDIVVVGLGFGDEAKGACVDHLAARYPGPTTTVVRFNGGAQAAHNVQADGVHHTFSQYGSGTLSGARTFLSSRMLVEPISLARETEKLLSLGVSNPLSLLTVSPQALITTLFHVSANRYRETQRGTARHGSCGRGIGETTWQELTWLRKATSTQLVENFRMPRGRNAVPPVYVRDCLDPVLLRQKLYALQHFYDFAPQAASVEEMAEVYTEFAHSVLIQNLSCLESAEHIIYEGAQGVLLDQYRGFHPYTTWSTALPDYPKRLQHALNRPRPYILGALRTYHTRHGAGPFPSEDNQLNNTEHHNGTGLYQGDWRQGHFDTVLARYALEVAGPVDGIALSHTDIPVTRYVSHYELPTGGKINKLPVGKYGDLKHQEMLTALLKSATPVYEDCEPTIPDQIEGVPVVLTSKGPDRVDRVALPALSLS